MQKDQAWIGIDYGAKLAGTTAICFEKEEELFIIQSQKKQDADMFIKSLINMVEPTHVYIDAPICLPAAYFGKGKNYFYRQCDIETKAMSPMFLGGLTARAMKLSADFPEIIFKETYPSFLVKRVFFLEDVYQKKKSFNPDILNNMVYPKMGRPIENWHQFDALMCWLSGQRDFESDAISLGNPEEGQIII